MKATRAATDSVGAVADSTEGTTSFAGEIIERSIPNADGKGETNTISNIEMGTVRVIARPELSERMDAPAISMEGVAEMLERMMPVDNPVINMTGIKGRYRLVLDVSLSGLPKLAPEGIGDSVERDEEVVKRFNEGLRKSGLQLERRRGPVESLFVDHWQKVPTGN